MSRSTAHLAILLFAFGCGQASGGDEVIDPEVNSDELDCALPGSVPDSLLETCFANVADGVVAPNLRTYQPQYEQYLPEGISARRWIYFPPSSQVDVSDADEWAFPTGTIVWQELSEQSRVETRMLEKTGPGAAEWRASTFLWKEDQADATRTVDGLAPGAGYVIDTLDSYEALPEDSCQGCHTAGRDAVLGFGAMQLSAQGRAGNLDIWQDYLSAPVTPIELVGDDRDKDVLGYLHTNCGSCHGAGGSEFTSGLNLRYSGASRELLDTPALRTSLYTETRLHPGHTAESNIYDKINSNGTGFTDKVFAQDVLADWIVDLEPRTDIIHDELPLTISADSEEGKRLLGYTTTANDVSEGTVFFRENSMSFRSRVMVPVDTTKTYRVSGRFKSVGAAPSKMYFGLSAHKEDGSRITHDMAHQHVGSVPGAVDLATTTKDTIYLSNEISGWQSPIAFSHRRRVGFFFDGNTARTPDFIHYPDGDPIASEDPFDGGYRFADGDRIDLNSPIPDEVFAQITADTVVTNQMAGGVYMYAGTTGADAPSDWTEYAGTITGVAFDGSHHAFRPETRYVKFAILANHKDNTDTERLVWDDLTLEEVEP